MDEEVTEWLKVLSRGPNDVVRRYSGYVINGYRFHTTSDSEPHYVHIMNLLNHQCVFLLSCICVF